MVEKSTCIYCGVEDGTTRDHVPPKAFFPKPRPSNLITVPACKKCNKLTEKDEEHFLATFMFGPAGVTQVGKQLWGEKLHRMYEKNQGIRQRIGTSLQKIEFVTPHGLFVRHGLGVKLERGRLESVVSKIVRGLYFFEYGEALPSLVEIVTHFVQSPVDMTPVENVVSQLSFGTRQWPGIFEYRFNRVEEKHDTSIWLIRFYESHIFWSVTDSKQAASQDGIAN